VLLLDDSDMGGTPAINPALQKAITKRQLLKLLLCLIFSFDHS
jgi:hypothetical protein